MRKRACVLVCILAAAGPACKEPPPVTVLDEPVRIVLEAESAKNDIAPFKVEENAECSGGGCLVLPEVWATDGELNPTFRTREGGRPVSMKKAKDNPLGEALVPNGTIELPFEVKTAGSYAVWVRAWLHCSCANSFFLSIDTDPPVDADGDGKYDENPPHMLGGSTHERWKWVTLRGKTFDLAEGRHIVRIFNREDGIRIDQVLLAEGTSGPVEPYHPQGMERPHP